MFLQPSTVSTMVSTHDQAAHRCTTRVTRLPKAVRYTPTRRSRCCAAPHTRGGPTSRPLDAAAQSVDRVSGTVTQHRSPAPAAPCFHVVTAPHRCDATRTATACIPVLAEGCNLRDSASHLPRPPPSSALPHSSALPQPPELATERARAAAPPSPFLPCPARKPAAPPQAHAGCHPTCPATVVPLHPRVSPVGTFCIRPRQPMWRRH